MRYMMLLATVLLAVPAQSAAPPAGPVTNCPRDAVVSGTGCMDKYEASVWRVPNPTTTNSGLVKSIQRGTATAATLTAAGATLIVGGIPEDYAPCTLAGDQCDDLYAVSLPGVLPSASINWFQAQAACTNSGKRLPSNAEWQAAVVGSPQPGPDDGMNDCATNQASRVPTGSRRACVSSDGAFDMVGNLEEWVADWVPRSHECGIWSQPVDTTGDFQCLAGAVTTGEPGALLRGGHYAAGPHAGPLAVKGFEALSLADFLTHPIIGFRCMR